MNFNRSEAHAAREWSAAQVDALLGALDALGLAWWTKDAQGRYQRLSDAGHALLGLAPGQAVGHTDAELLPGPLAAALRSLEGAAARAELGLAASAPEQAVDVHGVRRHLACVATPCLDVDAEGPDGPAVVGVWIDRTEQRQRETELRSVLEQLEQQQDQQRKLRAEIDNRSQPTPVRLVHREQFEDQLSREIDLSLREHREFAVVYIAIDLPPGLALAETTLRERIVSAFDGLLRSNTRAMDAPSRLDGERFALLLSGVGLATAHARMEGLRRQCATQVIAHDGSALRFTVSMGVASYPHTSQTQVGLQRAADTALEQARRRGGNHVALASIAFGGPTSTV